MTETHRNAGCLFLLAFLFALFHWPALHGHRVYENQWIFRNHAPFSAPSPGDLNALNVNSDTVTHYFADKSFVADAYRQGFLPLWNPYAFCGFPLYANGSSAVFSPLNFLFKWMSPYEAYNILLVLFFFLGATSIFYYLLKILKLSRPASLCGAAVLLFSPHLMEFVDLDSQLAFVWSLPLTLIVTEKLNGKKYVLAMASLLFAACLAGHIHVVINTLMVAFTYGLVVYVPRKGLLRFAGALAAAFLLFLGLAAFIIYPTLLFFKQSQWQAVPGGGWNLRLPLSFFTAVYPAAIKLPMFGRVLATLSNEKAWFNSDFFSVGWIPFVAGWAGAAALLRSRLKERRVSHFVVLFLFFQLSTALGVPGGSFLDLILMKFWHVYIFSSAVLCAWAAEELLKKSAWTGPFKAVMAFSGILIVVPVTAVSFMITFYPGVITRRLALFAEAHGLISDGLFRPHFNERLERAMDWFSLSSSFIWIPLLILVGLYFLLKKRPKRGTWLLFALVLADLWSVSLRVKPIAVVPASVFPRTEATDFLRADRSLFRVMSIQSPPAPGETVQKYVLKPNLATPYGLYDVGGQDSALNGAYVYFAEKHLSGLPDKPFTLRGILDFESIDLNVASYLNVKYVLAGDQKPLLIDGLRPLMTSGGMTIYQNERALPRFYFTNDIEVEADRTNIFKKMKDGPAKPVPKVWVERLPKGVFTGEPRPAPEDAVRCQVLSFKPSEAVVSVEAPSPGLLVYTDNFDTGWKAADNGKAAEVLRVNGLFKGLFLKPGPHTVRFYYHPDAFYHGLAVSLATMVFMVLLAAAPSENPFTRNRKNGIITV